VIAAVSPTLKKEQKLGNRKPVTVLPSRHCYQADIEFSSQGCRQGALAAKPRPPSPAPVGLAVFIFLGAGGSTTDDYSRDATKLGRRLPSNGQGCRVERQRGCVGAASSKMEPVRRNS